MNRLWNIRRLDPLPGHAQWVPVLGQLQKTLQKGEYLPLRPLPMFESNFVQVTSRGAPVYIHHRTNHLTMGVAASLPGPMLPDLLLIARPSDGRDCSGLILTRMIPLDLVHLCVHNLSAWRLKLCLITGRYYYLELNAPNSEVAFLFDRWIHLIRLLQEPAVFWTPRALKTPLSDLARLAPPASTWRLQDPSRGRCSVMAVDPPFPHKKLKSQKQRKAKTPKRQVKSQAVGDSVPLVWSQLEHPGTRKKAAERKSHPDFGPHSSQTRVQFSGEPNITIRTIFSNVSNIINQKLSSSKASYTLAARARLPGLREEAPGPGPCLRGSPGPDRPSPRPPPLQSCASESDGAALLGSSVGPPSHCISESSPDISLLVSYDHVDMQRNMEDLSDTESSTLSSDSLGQAAYYPSFYLPASYFSVPKHNQKARPPPSHETPSAPCTSWKDPFILDQSQKASAVLAPSWKAPAGSSAPQKTPVPASVPQKAPAIRSPSRKTPRVLAISQKVAAIRSLSRKTPPCVAGVPQEAVPCPVPTQKPLFLPTLSPKAPASPARYQTQTTLGSADLGPLTRGCCVENALERSQPEGKTEPLVLLGAQATKVTQVRAQKMPFSTTKKELKGVVISTAQDIPLDGPKDKGKLEDKVHGVKEGGPAGLPAFKPEPMRQQKWVKTQALAVEGGPQERRSPFSVKELTFAKMVILANSRELPLRPELVGLPSCLLSPQVSAASRLCPETLDPSQVTVLERTPAAGREAEKPLSDQRWPFKASPRSKQAPGSPRADQGSQAPTALPAKRWENIQPPLSPSSISKMEARAPQKPNREPQGTEGVPGQCPLATAGSSLEILMPKLLEIEDTKGMTNKMEKTKKRLSILTTWPRYLGRKDRWSYQQGDMVGTRT
ncbi:Golgi-associated RAB2 interactor protein 5B [Pteronotus mesoamericanus]|uniref:Golgi-associated RAB2 interactor protein 5B n=1 Tax=Pteronotus mesoamericanus TaxID=1884717 RepID=UPI0023ED2054|nr:Golgi-associated RAB2 interactor protein 5B [Pteronotus parnellii mesoamericanus]